MSRVLLVPVPELPAPPADSDISSPLVILIAAICGVSSIIFAIHVIRVIYHRSRSRRPLAAILITGSVMIISALLAGLIDGIQREAQQEALFDHRLMEYAAQEDAVAGIERSFGIAFEASFPSIPLEKAGWPEQEAVTLPDGTSATCWIDIEDDLYVVLCGGDSPETSTRLKPVER